MEGNMSDVNVEVPYKLLKNMMSLVAMEEHSMLKLAGMTLVQEFLKNDSKGEVKLSFLQNGLLEPLLLAFDQGLDDPTDRVYLELSLNCIFHLSELPVSPVQPLICEQVMKRLIQLVDQRDSFYRYSPSVKLNLHRMCENKHLVGRVQEMKMTADWRSSIHRTTNNQLMSTAKLTDTLFLCDVVDSGVCEKGLNIREHLLSRNLAWANNDTITTHETGNKDWKDILVTHVVEGPVFWAQIGIETIQNAQKIQAILNVYWKNGALEHCGCKKGDYVVVLQIMDGEVCPIRVRVMGEDSQGIRAWALDHGQVVNVDRKYMFLLPHEVDPDVYPAQVSLCCIGGLQEPPQSETAVNTGLATLCNLIKRSYPAGHLLLQLGGLDVCQSFLKTCPVVELRLQACKVLSNVSCNTTISNKCAENQFLPLMIGCVQEFLEMEQSVQKNELLLASLTALSNLMHCNDVNRSIFYHHQGGCRPRSLQTSISLSSIVKSLIDQRLIIDRDTGVEAVIKCSILYGRKHRVYRAAVKCIKMFICKALERNTSHVHRTKKSSPRKDGSTKQYQDTQLVMSKILEEKVEKEKFIWKPHAIEKALDESRFQEVESSDDELSDCHISLLDLQQMKEASQNSTKRPTVAVDVADVYRRSHPREFCVINSVMPIQNSSTNEVRPNKSITSISVKTVVQHVCGMLNSGKGGNIYFGLSPTGEVLGMKFTRDDRDKFRIGVDWMMTDRLRPCLLHSCFDVVYLPVVRKSENEAGSAEFVDVPDYFVAKIVLTPPKGALYTVVPEKDCYYRFGSHTTALSIQELRHLIILDEEEEFRSKINQLKAELKALLQQVETDG